MMRATPSAAKRQPDNESDAGKSARLNSDPRITFDRDSLTTPSGMHLQNRGRPTLAIGWRRCVGQPDSRGPENDEFITSPRRPRRRAIDGLGAVTRRQLK